MQAKSNVSPDLVLSRGDGLRMARQRASLAMARKALTAQLGPHGSAHALLLRLHQPRHVRLHAPLMLGVQGRALSIALRLLVPELPRERFDLRTKVFGPDGQMSESEALM